MQARLLQPGGSALTQRRWLTGAALAPAPDSLRDWFPVALDEQQVAWRHLPGRFTEPFFADELTRQPREARRVCFTPLDWLDRLEPGVEPSALVFHISRCGSTLLTQLLATLPHCIVQSEPPVLDDFLARHGERPHDADSARRLGQLVRALGQRRQGERHFVVKLDCWHLRHLPLLRAALPHTPFWFLYREPDAVMASHRRMRGPQMVPGMVLPAALGAGLAPGDLEGWCARVLAHFFDTALAWQHELHLIDYRQLPHVVWDELLPRLDVACSASELDAMRARSRFHAKAGATSYGGDPLPASATPPGLLEMLAPRYARLEAARLEQAGR